MAGEEENLSQTPEGSDHGKEMPTASEALASASASVFSSDDQTLDCDSDLQCEVKLEKVSASCAILKELFRDFSARRAGIVKALTAEAEEFYELCDPEEENLCLYGHPDETWDISFPDNDGPPDMPEPAVGINLARNGMDEKEWLALVAMHSDAWLLALTFYLWARFSGHEESSKYRGELFSMINSLPTIHEVVMGAAKEEPTKERTPNNNSKRDKSASKPPSPHGECPDGSPKRARGA